MAEKKSASSDAGKAPTLKEQDVLRGRFRPLLLQNPNYFGNLAESPFEAQLQIVGNKSYEEIGCVGYQPDFERLHAVVYVKRKTGYGGDICSNGSTEYVRFYLSFDGGASWEDQGVSSFKAYDIPENEERLEYAVTRRVDPDRRLCLFPNLIVARAILSWNSVPPPGQPDWKPVWGEVHDTQIEVDPIRFPILIDVLEAVEIEVPDLLPQVVDLEQPLQAKKPELSVAEKAALYEKTEVEPHRFAFAELKAQIDSPALSAELQGPQFEGLFPGLDIDFGDLGDLLSPTDGSTFYEELECVGYDPNTKTLVGVLRVKQPNGYSGGACTAGSNEFVTFWADLNDNGFFETCLGTAVVNVHDYENVPDEGLEYSVFLSVDLDKFTRPCEQGARLIPIRAILSWAVPAPCFNPDHVPVWGNREETIIHVPPAEIEGTMPVIGSVGDMKVPDIAPTGYATGFGVETSFAAESSPFGGRVDIAGKIVGGVAGSRYRVMVKPHGAPDTSYVPITNEPGGLTLAVGIGFNPPVDMTFHADANGYYPYQDYATDHWVDGNILMRWHTGALEHGKKFDLRVDLKVDADPANDIHSDEVTVHIDNEAPKATLDIDLSGTGVECADFEVGDTFTGNFSATDDHFRRFWFQVLPPGPANGVLPVADPPVPSNGLSAFLAGGSILDPGVVSGTYTLETDPAGPAGPMDPCGYSLTLWVESRTNVNSGTHRRRTPSHVGFCVRA